MCSSVKEITKWRWEPCDEARSLDRRRELRGRAFIGIDGEHPCARRQRERIILLASEPGPFVNFDASALAPCDLHRGIAAPAVDDNPLVAECEAIETIAEFKPNMIVSEVNFENGSVGYDLYLWIRTNVSTQDLPFLFLATRIDRDVLIAGKRLGVTDFILKPLDEDLVVASILNCLPKAKRNGRR